MTARENSIIWSLPATLEFGINVFRLTATDTSGKVEATSWAVMYSPTYLPANQAVPQATAADPEVALQRAGVDVSDQTSLQRGAKYYVNYCLGCHSLQYVRYNTMAKGLGLSEDRITENLQFTGERPHDLMKIAMPGEKAEVWFGLAPPDLSLIARARGTDWVYTFLKSFYADASRPTGVNNKVLPGTAMPHVLWELQGVQRAQALQIRVGPQARYYGAGRLSSDRSAPPGFAGVDVRQMHLDDGIRHRPDGIGDGSARMRVSGRVHDGCRHGADTLMQEIDDRALVVRLMDRYLEAQLCSFLLDEPVELFERSRAVHREPARAEEDEVGAVHD